MGIVAIFVEREPPTPPSAGSIYSWGQNYDGILGLGDTNDRSSPEQVGSETDWADIGGHSNTAAVNTDGKLFTWGNNTYGALGLGDQGGGTHRSSPTQVGSLTDWEQADGGEYYTMAIKTDGTMWGWGYGGQGRTGLGGTTNRSSPTQVGSLTFWTQVACGYDASFAITSINSMYSWGRANFWGILGHGADKTNKSNPTQIGSDTDWSQVAAGDDHAAAVKTDNTLWTWGSVQYGQLGNGVQSNNSADGESTPIQIGSTDWAQVSCGQRFTVAVKTNGTLWAWGDNYWGQLGQGNTTLRSSPVQVGSDTDWSQVKCGWTHVVAIKTDGTLWAWGNGSLGRLGDGITTARSSPVQVGSETDWIIIAGTQYCSFGIREV